MADYTKTTNFTAKDGLSTGDPLKLIKGSYFDTEFDAIATAITSKYDTNDIASQAQAEALSSNTVLMTPGRVNDVLADNASMLQDIQALTDPGVDTVLGWDNSATSVIGFTLGAGLEFSTTTINLADAVAGAGLVIASSILAVGAGNGLTVNADDVAITDAAATTSNPIDISSGAFTLDLTALTTMTGNDLAAGDLIYVDDGGVSKAVKVEEAGMRTQTAQATQTLAAADMNTIMEFTATATLTLPSGLPVGVPVVLNMKHATQVLTVLSDTGITLVSVNHPAGATAEQDTVNAGGTALIYQTAASVWCISGDISD